MRRAAAAFNGFANADIGHAAAQAAAHNTVNFLIRRVGIILQKAHSLHDLAGLAVAALRNLNVLPCFLHGVFAIGVQPFNGGYIGPFQRAERGDAGPGCPAANQNCAGTTLANTAAKLCARQVQIIAQCPQQGVSSGTSTETSRPLSLNFTISYSVVRLSAMN